MSPHNHEGSILSNVDKANRRHGPGTNFALIDQLPAGQPLIILCYTRGDTEEFKHPDGNTYKSDAWDFVVTGDQDRGGYVADVLIETGGDIAKQLGAQGTCDALRQHLANP